MAGGSQGANAPTGYAGGGYLPSTQFMGGPDSGADYAPANMGFDNSGSDGGVGGQPAPMMTPLSDGSRGFAFGGPTQPMGGFGTQPAYAGPQAMTNGPNTRFGLNPQAPGMNPQAQGPNTQFGLNPQAPGMNPQMPANFQKGVQPAYAGPQMMTNGPMAQPTPMGNKPLGLSQFQQPKGVQIQGNPTSQVVQRPMR